MNHFCSFLYVTFPSCFSFCDFFSCFESTLATRIRGQGFSSLWFCRDLCSTETAIQSVHLQWFHTLFYCKILSQWQSILSRETGETMRENMSTSVLNQIFVLVGNAHRLCSLPWTVKTGKICFMCVSEEKYLLLFLSLHFHWSNASI